MTDWSVHPDALALLESARSAPTDTLARHILADWLADNGQRGLASLLRLSLRMPGQIHHVSKNQSRTLPGVFHAVNGWLLGSNGALQARELTKQPWVNGLHLSGRGLSPLAQNDLLKALPSNWSPCWQVLSLADFTIPAEGFLTTLQKDWTRHITHMRLGGPFASSAVLAAITRASTPLETLELRSDWWRQDKIAGRSMNGRPNFPPPLEIDSTAPPLPTSVRSISLENLTLTEGALNGLLETVASACTRHLRLNQCHFSAHGLAIFNQSSIWSSLESLNLTGCRLPKPHPGKNDKPLMPIANNRLRSITLRACSLTGNSLEALARCGWLSGPTRIDLSQNHLSQLDARELEGNLDYQAVESLNLSGCGIDGEKLGYWLALGPWDRLGQLNVSCNPLGERGWRHLATDEFTPALISLDASSTLVTLQALENFANGSLFPKLARLSLRGKSPDPKMVWPESIRTLLGHPAIAGLSRIRFDAPEDWIQQEMASPECLLSAPAKEELLKLAETRLRETSRRKAEEKLNQQLMMSMGEHTGIYARWAARQRASRQTSDPTGAPGEPGS